MQVQGVHGGVAAGRHAVSVAARTAAVRAPPAAVFIGICSSSMGRTSRRSPMSAAHSRAMVATGNAAVLTATSTSACPLRSRNGIHLQQRAKGQG